ncbi:MAG: histidine phosphatase family protein [Bacteroidales bacterium]|nr:histidine phosphatase family protein [Bacteroidales bacterium]
MIKRIAPLFLLFWTLCAGAQTYDVLDIVRNDRQKASACEGPYRFDAPALTAAPRGYKPFYISHYGRHGSRYAWDSGTYTRIHDRLLAASGAGVLTERGRQLLADFEDFYRIPLINTGDLVPLGWEQHERIAETMADSFPEVFRTGGEVHTRVSVSTRALVSMSSFTLALQKRFPKLEITADSYHTNLPVTANQSAPRELAKEYAGRPTLPGGETYAAFAARKIDRDGILGRLFTDRAFFGSEAAEVRFAVDLFDLWGGYHNYSDSDFLEDLFTPDQRAALWEVTNYRDYIGHGFNRYRHIVLLQDFERLADEAIAGGNVRADLRFGHDHVLNAFYPLLNLDGAAHMPDSADEVKYWFQTYRTPMASNIQFILYRSRRTPDEILFKVLHNGAEATLPQLTPVSGPYYRWSDFKQWCAELYEEHPPLN